MDVMFHLVIFYRFFVILTVVEKSLNVTKQSLKISPFRFAPVEMTTDLIHFHHLSSSFVTRMFENSDFIAFYSMVYFGL